ncbi:hypothetical protein EJ03DRAFT_323329 [Teratosphaeria nubilosa]|uniref:RING-type E3 ubiquitin transferase n=1 Tax=Teratosphaeria nubilosa TaxID=161662 RepID=A0A6G1LM49_9PEZI|nr:hypothetical protein EJ03DRAFT_323329 [Teratosphaeria nubilosa]
MRPLRFLLTLAACILGFFILLFIGPFRASTQEDLEERSSISAYFNWRSPSSLFPPSAIISLTDDNSTFFLARPAAFGPLLPAKSLSGQLWVGSGFGDDRLGHGGSAGSEGELGCSDIPEWESEKYRSTVGSRKSTSEGKGGSEDAQEGSGKRRRSIVEDEDTEKDGDEEPTEDDGTDDHLHHPLPPSDGVKSNGEPAGSNKKPAHADIQSLQEGAEIAGKIVLLSRGGCGFLEKAKWVQRRGGAALIVGDDIRGGPLVTMYARGDTSNVTIPALFTSHTTAHLLSSLIPIGGNLDDISVEEAARLGLVLGDKTDTGKGRKADKAADKPNFTTTTATSMATSTAKPQSKTKGSKGASNKADEDVVGKEKVGWFKSLFGGQPDKHDSRRPPSSGKIGWVLQEDFDETEEDMIGKQARATTTTATRTSTKTSHATKKAGDGFVIGVQDWRDPDLVAAQKEEHLESLATASSSSVPQSSKAPKHGLKGGSITPGSGEYAKAIHEAVDLSSASRHNSKESASSTKHIASEADSNGWFGGLFGSGKKQPSEIEEIETKKQNSMNSEHQMKAQNRVIDSSKKLAQENAEHDGLWVTLTPTSMSSSPFFDTLLVLVVSPLVTLTVVYALLLLRSRIRRRRWRAPKSVVERLPVRTYQTMASTSGSNSSTTSALSSPVTATTPLLPSTARPINTARPRSRTVSDIPHAGSSLHSDSIASPSPEQLEEKRAAGLAEWRRRYGGKQRECVVCLEEYVDGVSRVMSLPCGHEFHAECITPWLTTRRRTCPICKGDVVRSLARSQQAHASSPLQQEYRDDPEDEEADIQEQAAVSRNDDPAAAQPVSREDEAFEDLESGLDRNR